MSVLKITKDLKLLEKQLREIETQVSDPIERIEHKKQLEKKIKNLERLKSQQEEYDRKQQELEELKSEFTLETNEDTVHINHTPLITESIIGITEQVDHIEPIITTSEDNISSAQQADNSQGFTKALIFGGVIGFLIFLAILINGNQITQTTNNLEQPTTDEQPVNIEQPTIEQQPMSTEQVNTTYQTKDIQEDETNSTLTLQQLEPSFTQQDAVNLLERWQTAKREIFAPPFSRELANELLTGKAYYDNVGNPQGSVAWLQNNASYYTYGVQNIDSVKNFAVDNDYATIEVIVTEQRTLYNQYGNIDQKASDLDTRLVRYNLEFENGQWKIAEYQTINRIR